MEVPLQNRGSTFPQEKIPSIEEPTSSQLTMDTMEQHHQQQRTGDGEFKTLQRIPSSRLLRALSTPNTLTDPQSLQFNPADDNHLSPTNNLEQHMQRRRLSQLLTLPAPPQESQTLEPHAEASPYAESIDDGPMTIIFSPSADHPTFLTLPPEIRRQVYLLLPDTVVSTRPLIYSLSHHARTHSLHGVCRQVREEVMELFYSGNTWYIKLEHDIMRDAFEGWIDSIGKNAKYLRVLLVSVRSQRFARPKRKRSDEVEPQPPANPEFEIKAINEGEATFRVDLSEKFHGSKVEVVRNDGSKESGEQGSAALKVLSEDLWLKRRVGRLTADDIKAAMQTFLHYTEMLV